MTYLTIMNQVFCLSRSSISNILVCMRLRVHQSCTNVIKKFCNYL